jgi:hypothetical protein
MQCTFDRFPVKHNGSLPPCTGHMVGILTRFFFNRILRYQMERVRESALTAKQQTSQMMMK